jgi:hypothetical protein
LSPLSLSCHRCYGVPLSSREQHPGKPRVFMSEGHGRLLLAPAFEESSEPLTAPICLAPHPPQRRPGSVDEELAQLDIPAFAAPQQTRLATRGVLPWPQPQPRGTLPSLLDRGRSTHGGDEGRGRQRSHPWDRL